MANDGITRADAAALFTEQFQAQVVQAASRRSVALQAFRTVPMGSSTMRMPVLAALPSAGFLSADQAVKPQSEMEWANKTLTAEEIAVIVPISETVIADAVIDVASTVRDRIAEAIGKVVDAAVFFGTGAPDTWPDGGLFGVADGASQTYEVGSGETDDNLGDDFNNLLAIIEEPGGAPTGIFGSRRLRTLLRGLKDKNGVSVYAPGVTGSTNPDSVWGLPLQYPLGWSSTDALAIAVDTDSVILGMRQDVQFTVLREATLTGFGNLAEKDSIAIRAVMRIGCAFADPYLIDAGERLYPVAALTPAAVAS